MKKLVLVLVLSCPFAGAQLGWSQGNLTAVSSGTTDCKSTNCVIIQLPVESKNVGITLSGTWAATVQFEASTDEGNTYVSLTSIPVPTAAGVTSSTANGSWVAAVGGMSHVRVRVSAFTSGTVVSSILVTK